MENIVNIKVIGIGGAGNNVVDRMIASGIDHVSYIAINTDVNTIRNSQAPERFPIGEKLTGGLGTGAKPELGEKAARDAYGKIEAALRGADMVFVTAGMGGGCGTGAAPVVASIAKDMGILTVAVVTMPFAFEGCRHLRVAEAGIEALRKAADALIVIPNNNLKFATDSRITFLNAFAIADNILVQTVGSIIELVQKSGLINSDFADVQTVMKNAGVMHVSVYQAGGANRAQLVFDHIRQSKLLGTSIDDAKSVLLCITAPSRVGLEEIDNLSAAVRTIAHPEANIIFGIRLDDSLGDDLQAMVIATSFEHPH